MKPRRWFITPELVAWKCACQIGGYYYPFWLYPNGAYHVRPNDNNAAAALRESLRLNFIREFSEYKDLY